LSCFIDLIPTKMSLIDKLFNKLCRDREQSCGQGWEQGSCRETGTEVRGEIMNRVGAVGQNPPQCHAWYNHLKLAFYIFQLNTDWCN